MEIDPFLLARIQFATNISFHIIFPSITIGLCWFLFFFRVRYTLTGDKAWEFAYLSWVKIFALTFALVFLHFIFAGYRCFNLILASSVVNRH